MRQGTQTKLQALEGGSDLGKLSSGRQEISSRFRVLRARPIRGVQASGGTRETLTGLVR